MSSSAKLHDYLFKKWNEVLAVILVTNGMTNAGKHVLKMRTGQTSITINVDTNTCVYPIATYSISMHPIILDYLIA